MTDLEMIHYVLTDWKRAMKETEAIIERVKRINVGFQHLELAVDNTLLQIKPGQSLLAHVTTSSWHPYLREQWWPVAITQGKLVVERPIEEQFNPGQIVRLLGLIGQPYRFRRVLRNVLLVAYDTAPTPLLMTIPWLLGNNISVTMVLLGLARDYATPHLPPEIEVVQGETDDPLSWPDQVMTVGWADQVFVTVAQGNEQRNFHRIVQRFKERRADIPQNYLFGVFQPMLPCGAGACQACMINMQKSTPLSCSDGPAFDLTQVMLS